jgi:hypothetical protein
MAELRIAFRLPPRFERALFVSDYGLRGGKLLVGGALVVDAPSREALCAGVTAARPESGPVTLRADGEEVRVFVDGVEATREDRLRAPISRSAWIHAALALSGSVFGLIASWLYLLRARAGADAWAMKMAVHMAAWHLFLVLTLFPASVWGQRLGIRAVQGASLVFFLIHAGIALANLGAPSGDGPLIGLFNAASGVAFAIATVYGQRAHADMDPLTHR